MGHMPLLYSGWSLQSTSMAVEGLSRAAKKLKHLTDTGVQLGTVQGGKTVCVEYARHQQRL